MIFWRLTPKVRQRKLRQSGAARQASTGQSTRDEGSARWAAQKGPAGSAGRLSVQNSHSGCFEQGITLTLCPIPLTLDLGAGALPGFQPARCLLQSLGAPH
jgi:hypothetical protein